MNTEIGERKNKIILMIEKLVNCGKLCEARESIAEYEKEINKNDAEILSIKAVTYIMQENYEAARLILKKGMDNNCDNFDNMYNLAYTYEMEEKYNEALKYYELSENVCSDFSLKNEIKQIVNKIESEHKDCLKASRKKIVFFVKKGMDSFLGNIIEGLCEEYETKKVIVTDVKQIEIEMQWSDICWFEWCDEIVFYGSNLKAALNKKIICRIHGYEVYTNIIRKINWKYVDDLIIVAPHIRRIFEERTKDINMSGLNVHTVFCGVNVNRFPLNIKNKGYNLGYLGYINFKKNIPLTLDIFKKLHDLDDRYKLYIAGEFQDDRTLSYFDYYVDSNKLNDCIFFDGWQEEQEKIQWFKKIDYMVISSIDEGLCFAAAEAMCSGIKPVLHNCEGLRNHYDKKYIFTTLDDAVKMIAENEYSSSEYRDFIRKNYSIEREEKSINKIINASGFSSKAVIRYINHITKEKVIFNSIDNLTMTILSYNRGNILKKDLINGFKLGNQKKIIVDDCSTSQCDSLKWIENNKEKYNIDDIIRSKANIGVAGSRKIAYRNVYTKYTVSLDDDDMLFCINPDNISKVFDKLENDSVIYSPRYLINLYDDGEIKLGYDRSCYNEKNGNEMISNFAEAAEIMALFAGSISLTSNLLEYVPTKYFKAAEDHLLLTRLFAANLHKKVLITDDFITVRRIHKNSLCGNISNDQLAINFICHAVSCYYCLKNKILNEEHAIYYMKRRGELIQKIYGFGIQFVQVELDYLYGRITEIQLIKFLRKFGITCNDSLDELAVELKLMHVLLTKN